MNQAQQYFKAVATHEAALAEQVRRSDRNDPNSPFDTSGQSCLITSIEIPSKPDHRPGQVVQVSLNRAARAEVDRTHRLSTSDEVRQYRIDQEVERQRIAAQERKNAGFIAVGITPSRKGSR